MLQFQILNTVIHSLSINELRIILENELEKKSTPQLLTTFNLDFLRIANNDIEFSEICNNALFNLPDGFGITSLIKVKFGNKIERITGNDIFPLLLELANKGGYRIAIIGGSTQVSKKVEQKIMQNYSYKKKQLLCISPSYNFELNDAENEIVINRISTFRPNIVFAALGCPRQEKWLYKNMNRFGSQINIGIGATLDFFSETKKRSPLIFQRMGFEWFWRLINEPYRLFDRYILKDIPFYVKMIFHRKY